MTGGASNPHTVEARTMGVLIDNQISFFVALSFDLHTQVNVKCVSDKNSPSTSELSSISTLGVVDRPKNKKTSE